MSSANVSGLNGAVGYHGFLEKYNREEVAGWVTGPKKDSVIVLSIYLNGRNIGICSPEFERQDFPNRKAGFKFKFPEGVFDEITKAVTVDVRFFDTEKSVGNAPAVFAAELHPERKVLVGLEGYLFLRSDTNRVLDQVAGRVMIDVGEKDVWRKCLADREGKSQKYEIPLHYLIVPDKERVYERFLPIKGVGDNAPSIYHQWKELMPESSTFYPLKCLTEKSYINDTYSKGDTHWNAYGAYLALREMDDLFLPHLPHGPFVLNDEDFEFSYGNGDLLSKLGGICIEPQTSIKSSALRCRTVKANGRWLTGRDVVFASTWEKAAPLKILCFHDSFGPYLERLIASVCMESRFIWSAEILWDQVQQYQPDIILMEQVERFLLRSPRDAKVF